MTYELVFEGGTPLTYQRKHRTYESAEVEAYRVLNDMDEAGGKSASQTLEALYRSGAQYDRAAHPAIIYGPDCGKHGVTIR